MFKFELNCNIGENITFQKISDLSKVKFETSVNESLKNDIIKVLQSEEDKNSIKSKIFKEHEKLIIEIQENSSIQIILTNKNNPKLRVNFKQCFPTSLSGIDYNTQTTDTEQLTATVTMKYDLYEFETL